MNIKYHIVVDRATDRTFKLGVAGDTLQSIEEFLGYDEGYLVVTRETEDGNDWWEQWAGEVEAGQFR